MEEKDPKVMPIKIQNGDDQFIRVQYNFCPKSVAESTASRSLIHDDSHPSVGYIDHTLNNGEKVRFQGTWKPQNESMKECIFLFTDDEVSIVPINASLLKLKKSD
ncbi:hypothetical protein M9Y10_022671 [Tritrichomonas musculus]|uniref:Transcription elongation factor Eaf N-terminal domain-containing protein n=1 Tax=Tritrichomonas musculus TaxID=1915356 RepID=A0ABR2KTH5_9EUKA